MHVPVRLELHESCLWLPVLLRVAWRLLHSTPSDSQGLAGVAGILSAQPGSSSGSLEVCPCRLGSGILVVFCVLYISMEDTEYSWMVGHSL